MPSFHSPKPNTMIRFACHANVAIQAKSCPSCGQVWPSNMGENPRVSQVKKFIPSSDTVWDHAERAAEIVGGIIGNILIVLSLLSLLITVIAVVAINFF